MSHPEKLLQNAIARHRAGDLTGAEALYRKLLGKRPRLARAHLNLGVLLQTQGRPAEAAPVLRRATELAPDDVDAQMSLGLALRALGDVATAALHYRRAAELKPALATAHFSLGNALIDQGHTEEAIAAYDRAIAARPDFAEALDNRGLALERLGQPAAAEQGFRAAIAAAPGHAGAHNNLGRLLRDQGRLEEAVSLLRQATRLRPGYAKALANLAVAQAERGDHDDALTSAAAAVAAAPDFAEAASTRLYLMNMTSTLAPAAVADAHRDVARRHAPAALARTDHPNRPDPGRKLRVGYVSPDLRQHSVAYFLEPLLGAHDRGRFHISAYADVARPDAVTRRLQGQVDAWCDASGLGDAALAERIAHDGIDVLVDLAGHTARNRLRVFARRPAPIQMTYLGYPGTTGLTQIDARLTDAWADPPGAEALHSEALLRIEGGFLAYRPPADAPPVAPLPAEVAGRVMFGSMNNAAKLSTATVALWARVLAAVPDAALLLKARGLDDASTADRVRERFARHGVAPERLHVAGRVAATGDHLATYGRIDIALDPLPYNGTTTTCEALWMGVPVVALAGDRHAARVGVSILSAAGLGGFVARSDADYVAIASEAAADVARLARLRADLRRRLAASPLLDAERLARKVEAAMRTLWCDWCRSQETAAVA